MKIRWMLLSLCLPAFGLAFLLPRAEPEAPPGSVAGASVEVGADPTLDEDAESKLLPSQDELGPADPTGL